MPAPDESRASILRRARLNRQWRAEKTVKSARSVWFYCSPKRRERCDRDKESPRGMTRERRAVSPAHRSRINCISSRRSEISRDGGGRCGKNSLEHRRIGRFGQVSVESGVHGPPLVLLLPPSGKGDDQNIASERLQTNAATRFVP